MDNTRKMSVLLGRLRTEMNGAVAGSMNQKGICYPLNYGVSFPTIKKIAGEYHPDHDLAMLLWQQQVRELKLASILIADSKKINPDEITFWEKEITNTELAEYMAVFLISGIRDIERVVERWLSGENELLHYCGLMSVAKRLSMENIEDFNYQEVLSLVMNSPTLLNSENYYIWKGVSTLFNALLRYVPKSKMKVGLFLSHFSSVGSPASEYLEQEVGWQFQQSERS